MAEIFLPKWKPAETNGSQFMKNLDRHLRYEVDLEKYEAKKREIECVQENGEGGQLVNEFFRDNSHLKAKSFSKKTFVAGGFNKPSFA